MATWDPIDPADVVDLQFDFSVAPSTDGSKSFIPAGVGIASHTVTAPTSPPGLVIVSSSLAGKKVYFRTGPSPEEDYWVHFHLMLDNGEQRDTDAFLRVRQRRIR